MAPQPPEDARAMRRECVLVHMCVRVYVSACDMYGYICVYVEVPMCVRVYVSVCVYVCVYMFVCVSW